MQTARFFQNSVGGFNLTSLLGGALGGLGRILQVSLLLLRLTTLTADLNALRTAAKCL
jgi:hypothetical protein